MKRIVVALISLLLVSCGTSAVVKEATQTMKGDWRLTSINYPGNEENLDVTLFNDVPSECLENSKWFFRTSNNTGSYEPAGMSCTSGPNFFIWSITEMDAAAGNYDLMLKPTDADYDSTMNNKGYRINLVNLTATQMVWEQTITFEGQPFTIRMNFNKL
ncbi:lipocalin family protein [Salinimicrobium soli]|uniref:lipocalin family protein n=1 Tax=Salinimicrobium soli TaxID=1254399 RepID=UPI003AAA3E86